MRGGREEKWGREGRLRRTPDLGGDDGAVLTEGLDDAHALKLGQPVLVVGHLAD